MSWPEPWRLDGPGDEDVSAEQAEPELRRAIAMVKDLNTRAPRKEYAAALARWNSRLAWLLDDLGRTDEAAAHHRAAIDHDEWLAGELPDNQMVRAMLASRRTDYAGMLIRKGRRDDARPLLDQAAADLRAVAEHGRPIRWGGKLLDECVASLADLYEDIGDATTAAQLRAWSDKVLDRGPEGRAGRDGADGGVGRGDRPRGPGRKPGPR